MCLSFNISTENFESFYYPNQKIDFNLYKIYQNIIYIL